MSSTRGKTAQNPLTPTVFNQMLKNHLSDHFGSFWLSGEIFEYYRSPAGHSYFTIKDQTASIKCVLFKQKHSVSLSKGMQVTLLGQLSMYIPKGEIQVNALKVMETGQGDLEQQFQILKQKLMKAGLFEPGRKKSIPQIINSVGIITSSQSAALQDVLNVFIKNNPLIEISIYHTAVQGAEAPPQINHALRTADDNKHDLLLLTRGGGSKEDLWAFNDEFLAYQLAQLTTPVISAVGHETDESISDLVADFSCITPTAAAHFIAGDFNQLKLNLNHNSRLLQLLMQEKLRVYQQKIDISQHKLDKQHPENAINQQKETLINRKHNLQQAFNSYFRQLKSDSNNLKQKLFSNTPQTQHIVQKIRQTKRQLDWQIKQSVEHSKQSLGLAANDLNNKNPLEVLSRGYSVTTKLDDHTLIKDVSQVQIGDNIATQLKSGRIHAKIFERLE